MAYSGSTYKVEYRGWAGTVKAVNYSSAVQQFAAVVTDYGHSIRVPGVREHLERAYSTTIESIPDRVGG